MTTNPNQHPYRRTKACLLILIAIAAFPITLMILIAACHQDRR